MEATAKKAISRVKDTLKAQESPAEQDHARAPTADAMSAQQTLVRALRDLVDAHAGADESDIPSFPTRPQIRSESAMLPHVGEAPRRHRMITGT
jgi:hypothetical protein